MGFRLSLRNVENLLHERGVEVSRQWYLECGPTFAAEIRQGMGVPQPVSRWRWHLDEVLVKGNGVPHHLWRFVDHEGEMLQAFVTKRRNKAVALRFPRKLMQRRGRPEEVLTDKLRSYGAAPKHIGAPERRSAPAQNLMHGAMMDDPPTLKWSAGVYGIRA